MMEYIRVHLLIYGKVQGVWFRDSTRQKAHALGISGWVKNKIDGTVEVLAEGPENIVNELVSWCYIGPPYAKVDRIESAREIYEGIFNSFDILRTS